MAEKFKAPVEKGKTYTIDILRLGSNGEGVGRVENFTVFVDGALPGETVTARITFVKKQYATGRLEKVQKPSEHRVKPPCSVYADCGGCQYSICRTKGSWRKNGNKFRMRLKESVS